MIDQSDTENLVAKAIRAPSSHNTQPWIFQRLNGGGLRLRADRTRALPINDPEDRELTISCGCALFNLRVAAASRGLKATVRYQPCPDQSDILAQIDFGAPGADRDIAALAASLDTRRTYRKPFKADAVSSQTAQRLQDAARAEGAILTPLDDGAQRAGVAELVGEGDATQWTDAHWRRELAAWMHPRRHGDGLTLPWPIRPLAKTVVRRVDMGANVGARDRKLAQAAPFLAILETSGDTTAHWLSAGQALERVLLTAAKDGLQASYLNQPIQVARLRHQLHSRAMCDGYAQIVLRLGFPRDDAPASPRRPLEEVMRPAGP